MSLRDLLRVIGPGQKTMRNLTLEEAQGAFEIILSGTESNSVSYTHLTLPTILRV